MSEIEKIKAAHAARKSRRSRPPRPPTSSVLAPSAEIGGTEDEEASNGVKLDSDPSSGQVDGDGTQSEESALVSTLKKQHSQQVESLRQQISTLNVELSSLRRNHLENVKAITQERDMFAAQLAAEQSSASKSGSSGVDSKKLIDLEAQLRASRTRNSDLEAENTALRDEVKQLTFLVQANKTFDAASDGYNKVVKELVHSKLKCAQLQEEKEDLLRINKELTTTSAVLRDANGELEKSRSEWVVQCAELEKRRAELEDKVKEKPIAEETSNDATSYIGSDLQELKL